MGSLTEKDSDQNDLGTQSGLDAKYEIGFEAPLGIANRKPIHESIAIVAFINSSIQFPSGTKYDNLDQKQWEFIRGLIWNDDPSCLLLADLSENNHKFGIGLQFFDAFLFGPANCMTKRSHFGNLQFLHAMATKVGEPAQTTKQNLMSWLEVMYKLACLNQGISANDQLVTRLPNHFDSSTVPTGSATLKELILATTPSYNEMKIEDRALGICLHIIQDSYAIGHTQRSLLNPQDLAPRDPQGKLIQFSSSINRISIDYLTITSSPTHRIHPIQIEDIWQLRSHHSISHLRWPERRAAFPL